MARRKRRIICENRECKEEFEVYFYEGAVFLDGKGDERPRSRIAECPHCGQENRWSPKDVEEGEIIGETYTTRIQRMAEESPSTILEGGKAIMTACTFFISVYAFILSEAGDRNPIVSNYPLLFAFPIVFFGVSMISAVWALFPLRHHVVFENEEEARNLWLGILEDKFRLLMFSIVSITLGLVGLLVCLVYYLRG